MVSLFFKLPFQPPPPKLKNKNSLIENFQHIHWTFYVHFQQNFTEAKEKGWVFLPLRIKKIAVFKCWELKIFLIQWKASAETLCCFFAGPSVRPGSSSVLGLWIIVQYRFFSLSPSVGAGAEHQKGCWCCIFVQQRSGSILSRAAPCDSQSCQELEAKCPKHGVLWQKLYSSWNGRTVWFASPSFWKWYLEKSRV